MKEVIVYTDGSCDPNPGPGGWAAILKYNNNLRELSQPVQNHTTNNRCELLAAIEALKALKEPCNVLLHSDSAYVVNAFNKNWIPSWISNKWLNSESKPVMNRDLWEQLIALVNIHKVTFIKVKGHGSDRMNIRCDELAKKAQKKAVGF